MIIKAQHNFFIDSFFRFYVIWKMKSSFHSIHFKGEFSDQNKPILLICNHMSWWDGIWALHFNQTLLYRKYHFMMQKDQLEKNWFFKYTGGFSIEKKSRSVVETIDYTTELLQNPNNVVLMFPQGEIESMHQHEFIFEKGIEKILQKTDQPMQIIFLANVVDYFSNPKPEVNIYFEEFRGARDHVSLEKEYNTFYTNCIQNQITNKS